MLSTPYCWADWRGPNILGFSVFVLHCPTPRQRNVLSYEQVCGITRYSIVPAFPLGRGTGAPGSTQETASRTPDRGDARASGDRCRPQKKATADLLRGGGLCRRGARRDSRRYGSARAAVFAYGVVPLHGDLSGGQALAFRFAVPPFAPVGLLRAGSSLPRIGR
jgi:hypothetical protein